MSVAWLEILGPLNSQEVKTLLSENGVHVLAGNQFFWSEPQRGDKFIRVALNRDPDMFQKAMGRLSVSCRKLVF